MNNNILLQVQNLCQYFKSGQSELKAVDDISFSVRKGEVFWLVGESGCGKTTTGRSIIRLYNITSGNVYFKGTRIAAGTRALEEKLQKVKSDGHRKIAELKREGKTQEAEKAEKELKAEEKNRIMEEFLANKIQILVSTTVIEVGVDVPNATVIMVENAERFGLAQLHQLRGRVGRGDAQSYCILMQGNETKTENKRLSILNRSNDGFYIAGEDLKLRGPGDFFGIRQSGEFQFQVADIYQDADMMGRASYEVSVLMKEDPGLTAPGHRALKARLKQYAGSDFSLLNL